MSESQAGTLELAREDALAILTLNDPPHNPIGIEAVDRLEELLPELGADRSVRVLLITGAGERSFSVGANIREFGTGLRERGLRGFIEQRWRVLGALERFPKPVVCAIRGLCLGGGLELALACHFRVAAEDARLGLPEIELGILPAWGGTQRLPRLVGRARALEMILRGRRVDAREALEMGLVHEVCAPAELAARARAWAGELAAKAPLAVEGALRAVIEGAELPLPEGLALELEALERASASADAREGVQAFLEKRRPRFRGE